ncbi:MAG: tRNA (adenosine(37)-N6)-dimethylallyltransferase MiaA [Candidatus Gracilibacteria bacterium]|nr:tRNA (adenosine(37)-N6)-dimethylallyltransferase MiaA [Candidatus Gracilibacteria bacterium]
MKYKEKIKHFLDKKSDKQKIIIIYGPTAAGKTAMSIDIAKELNTEIISTDSRQIFKYMDVGTAKIKKEEMQGVKHHMIDIVEPDYTFSVGEYKAEAEKIINKLHESGKIPVLVGGTGLYIDSLIYDFDIPKVPADLGLRGELEIEAKEMGNEHLYNKLVELDPEYAKELHPNNVQYVIRALEVKMLTGKSKADFRKKKVLKYETLFLTPYVDDNRQELYNRINMRVDMMFEQGLLQEFKKLIDMGYSKETFAMKSIGYEELFDYIEGKTSLEETKELIKKNTRNYAKRQLTWFRRYDN